MIHRSIATPADAFELVLREEDSLEVSAGWREGVALDIQARPAFSYRDDQGTLLGLAGAAFWDHEVGVWLLASATAGRHRLAVWRLAKRFIKGVQAAADGRLVYNFIPKNSPRNRAFVEALGFRILPSPRDGFDFFYLPCLSSPAGKRRSPPASTSTPIFSTYLP